MKKIITFLMVFIMLSSGLLSHNISAEAAAKKPKLNIQKLNLTVGGRFTLRAYNLKKKYRITFTSSKRSVATTDETASDSKRTVIRAKGIGSATITGTIRKNKKIIRKLKCRVSVSPSAVSIKFLKRSIHLRTKEHFRVEPVIKPNTSTEQPIYESDNPSVATVNSRGVVTAIAPGKATITATLLSTNQSASCRVEVKTHHGDESDVIKKMTKANIFLPL